MRHLIEDRGASAEEAERAAAQSDGVVGRALEIWERGPGDATESGARLLSAALSGDARARFEAAGAFSARGARAALQPALEALRAQLRDVLAHATGAAELPPGLPSLRGRPLAPGALLTAMEAVEDALEGVAQNLNPQATVSVLLGDMNRVLAASTREP